MTDEELAAIKARAEAATQGPWYVAVNKDELTTHIDHRGGWGSFERLASLNLTYGNHIADAAFVARAREDIPALLADLAAWREIGRAVAHAKAGMYPSGDHLIFPLGSDVDVYKLRHDTRALLGESDDQ